jgi:hypothetical protein
MGSPVRAVSGSTVCTQRTGRALTMRVGSYAASSGASAFAVA